ncbi:MAG TPA: hypothetical protein P5509_10560, partial [Bacteroidales bacterium]|nr:hypothetical protein [Bacteroidales bacterium]
TNKVVFGGKKFLKLRSQDKITKEEWSNRRLLPLNIQGEQLHKGNRSFDFSSLSQGKLVLKLNRKQHITLTIPKQRKNYQRKLQLIETLTATKDLTVSVRLTDKFVYLSYEEPKLQQTQQLNDKRFLGIDLNPNHIGVSVMEWDKDDNEAKVIYTTSFDFSKLTKAITSEDNSSHSNRFKYLNNKLQYETIMASKVISQIAKDYKCKFVFVEDLKKIDTGDSGFGKRFNRLTRNLWKRGIFETALQKRLSLLNIKIFKVNAAYSSFIGNLQHNYFDPCNAACEIGRRGYEVIIIKNKKFYPNLSIKTSMTNQWKEDVIEGCSSWKKLYNKVKNSKLRYRVPLESCDFRRFKMFSKRSKVFKYEYVI